MAQKGQVGIARPSACARRHVESASNSRVLRVGFHPPGPAVSIAVRTGNNVPAHQEGTTNAQASRRVVTILHGNTVSSGIRHRGSGTFETRAPRRAWRKLLPV